MDAQHLSKRLAVVASYVPQGARLADIGSDHGYLPAALALQGKVTYAVAGEVVKGPYENAVHEIEDLHLQHIIHPRLADGLAAIHETDRIDTITIAGMGGALIAQILDANPAQLAGVKRLILQPNVGEPRVRAWLMAHRFQIMAEQIIADEGHIYEIIVAEPSVVPFTYSQFELTFGPFLLEHRGPVFRQKWQEELTRQQQVMSQMEAAPVPPVDKINHLRHYLHVIKEVINHDHGNGLN